MPYAVVRPDRNRARRIAQLLAIVLFFLSSRSLLPPAPTMKEESPRPRPGRQDLPTRTARGAPIAERTGEDAQPPPFRAAAPAPTGAASTILALPALQQLLRQSTTPAYLRFFQPSASQSGLAPPA